MIFRGKMLKHAFYHFCSAENSVCVKPSLFITTFSVALKIMKSLQWLSSCMCSSLKKFQVHVLCASVWIYLLFNCFSRVKINAFDRRLMLEKFGWHAFCFQVELVNFGTRLWVQVRVLLILCLAMLFSLFNC